MTDAATFAGARLAYWVALSLSLGAYMLLSA